MTLSKLGTNLLILLGALAVAGAGLAWLTDRRATAREVTSVAAYPPEGQLIETALGRVHAVVRGEGPDLVLIHGASGNARDFTFDLVARLEADFRVIVFDRPGLGHSDPHPDAPESPIAQAESLRAAAAVLGVRAPVVLGHSYGGAVAMAWALAAAGAADDPTALVLLAGATHPWPGDLGLYYRVLTSGFGQHVVIPLITAFAPRSRAVAVAEGIFEPQSAPPGYTDHVGIGLAMRRQSLRLNALQVGGLKPFVRAMAPGYSDLTQPIEIVHGTADTTVGIAYHSEPMIAEVASARLTRLEGIGHMPQHAATDEVLAAIRRAAARAAGDG